MPNDEGNPNTERRKPMENGKLAEAFIRGFSLLNLLLLKFAKVPAIRVKNPDAKTCWRCFNFDLRGFDILSSFGIRRSSFPTAICYLGSPFTMIAMLQCLH